jgi:hypothetical protein
MPHRDPGKPDLTALRVAAEGTEFTQAKAALTGTYGYRLAGANPLAPLARDLARSLTEAGLTVHHCARYDPLYRLGGVCLLRYPPVRRPAPAGSWCPGPRTTFCSWTGTGTAPTPGPSRP